MKAFVLLAGIASGSTAPTFASDSPIKWPTGIDNAWRVVPIMPGVFLESSTKYSLFAQGSKMYITFQGRFDNGGKSPIESDGTKGVARGFFLQDMTYGFDSLDGFVVWFKGNNFATKWD